MKGFIYRLAIRIKNHGVQMGCIPVLGLFCGPVIALGITLKNWALNQTVEGF